MGASTCYYAVVDAFNEDFCEHCVIERMTDDLIHGEIRLEGLPHGQNRSNAWNV